MSASTEKLITCLTDGQLEDAAHDLEQGANPNALSCDGASAMHIAAGVGVEAVRLLLAHGGDSNIRSVDGSTPLHVAAAWGDKDILRLLLHNGANPNLIDQDGQRALDVAACEGHTGCVDFLKYYSMLVAIGDEEEVPKYTVSAEPLDDQQTDLADSQKYLSKQSPHTSDLSLDEEDLNLSAEYVAALSRRLNRLLYEGEGACLDVTSPGCPYIASKSDSCLCVADKTVLAADFQDHLISSDSEEEEFHRSYVQMCKCCSREKACSPGTSSAHLSGRHTGARRVKHRCVNNHGLEPQSLMHNYEGTNSCAGISESRCPDHQTCCQCEDSADPKMFCALDIERKMRQRYFPDVNSSGETCMGKGASRSPSKFSPHSASPVRVPACSCKGGYFRSPLPCSSDVHEFGSAHQKRSPCLCSSPVTSCKTRPPIYPNRCSHHPSHHSASPTSHHQLASHHSPHRSGSPTLCSPSVNRSGGHREDCSPSRSKQTRSSCPMLPGSRSPLRHHTSFHSQLENHSPHLARVSPECHQQKNSRCLDLLDSSLKKQSTFPPPSKQRETESTSTVMSMLCSPRRLPPDFDYKPSSKSPFMSGSPRKNQPECTRLRSNMDKQDIPAAGSNSAQSVDSGYGECVTSVSARKPNSKNYGSPNACYFSGVSEAKTFTHPQKGKLVQSSKPESKEEKSSRETEKMAPCMPLLSEDSKSGDETFTSGDFDIISGNIRGPKEWFSPKAPSTHLNGWSSGAKLGKNDARPTLGPAGDAGTVKQASTLSALNAKPMLSPELNVADDVTRSSCDSFRTCEEAASDDSDITIEYQSDSQRTSLAWSLSKTGKGPSCISDSGNKKLPNSDCTTLSKNRSKKERSVARESFGFVVSDVDDTGKCADGSYLKPACDAASPSPKKQTTDTESKVQQDLFRNSRVKRDDLPQQKKLSLTLSKRKAWVPPVRPIVDESNLLTSDESFLSRLDKTKCSDQTSLSKWIDNLPTEPADISSKVSVSQRIAARLSDESMVSSSSLREFVYRDKENGITLIERHIPSDYDGSSGRPSIESACSVDSQETVPYDWADLAPKNDKQTSDSSASSFDITAGQTLISETDGTVENSDDKDWEFVINSEDELSSSDDSIKKKKKPKKNTNQPASDSSEKSIKTAGTDKSTPSSGSTSTTTPDSDVTVPYELQQMSDEAIFQSLKDLGEDPGPVLPSTRQAYLVRLASLQSGNVKVAVSAAKPGYSSELNHALAGSLDMEELAKMEQTMVAQFQTRDGRTWREGTIKSCFNYLLLDPRVTKNLPLRAKSLSDQESFKTFLAAVFYIGKGKRSRPYCHLYEAISQLRSPKPKMSEKVKQILDIWSSGAGVVSLHCFQNVIPVEAYTREACMVDAIGLGRLTNVKRGDYYGVASTWSGAKKRSVGAFLLRKAFQIFLSEGERQICPPDIQRGK